MSSDATETGVTRVAITSAAHELVTRLVKVHGPVLFHQSGGCCDGSSPMCYPRDEFKVGGQDVYLGDVKGTPVWIGAAQFEVWKHTHVTIDVVPGRGSGFSLEAPDGVRFISRSRVLSDVEAASLAAQGPPRRGDG